MHHSRLSNFIIDCQTDDIRKATEFWSKALGREVLSMPGEPNYRELKSAPSEPQLCTQKVDHESRIHLDIETDDLEAEVKRLEGLGAKRVAFVKRWWVMEAPTGQKFCVVNPQRGPLAGAPGANRWP